MAQSVGAVALDIVMGKNTVSSVVGQAMRDVQKTMGDASATLGQKVSSVGNAVSSMGASVMPASAAMTALGGSCVKTAANFESSMSEVQAISGATGKDFDALRDKAQEMGAKTKFSASQSAEAMTYMAMAGWKTEDMLGGISGIMNLAAASGEDLATTSDIVTDALTAFGKSAKDSGELADIMAAASSNANTNVSMMGETFKYAAPIAGALGYTMQDTALAIGLMANAGIKGTQAGTSLRSMFTRLASPPDECANAMEKLGISITNADGTMKPFRSVIGDLRTAFSGLSEAEQAQYAKALAGQEAMSGLLAIVNAAPSDVEKLTGAIDNSNGAAEKMANTMNDNLNGKITLLKSQLEGLAIEMGTALTPMLDKVIDAVSKVATWFGSLDDSTKQTVITIGLVVAAAGPVLLITGKLISSIGSIISVLGKAGSLLGTFGGAIAKTAAPSASAASGVGALSKNALGLVAAGAGILLAAAGLSLLAYAAIQLAQAGTPAIACMGGMVVSIALLAGGAALLAPALTAGAVGLVAFGGAVALVGVGILAATSGVALLASQLPTISEYGASAGSALITFGEGVAVAGAGALVAGSGLTVMAVGLTATAVGSLAAAVGVTALGAGVLILSASVLVLGAGLVTCGAGLTLMASSGRIAASGMARLASAAASAFVPIVAGTASCLAFNLALVAALIPLGAFTVELGASAIACTGLSATMAIVALSVDSIKNSASTAGESLKDMVSSVDIVKTGLDGLEQIAKNAIGSIVKVFSSEKANASSSAKLLATGVTDSIKNGFQPIETNTKNTINKTNSIISSGMNKFSNTIKTNSTASVNAMKNCMSSMNSAASSGMNKINSTIRNGMTKAVSYLEGLSKQSYTWGADMMDGMARGINSKLSAIQASVISAANKIKANLHFSRPDEGPLTDYETWMPDFIQGMAKGIDDNKYKLIDAVQSMAGDMRLTMPMNAPMLKNVGGYNAPVQTDTEGNSRLVNMLTQLVENLQYNTGDITIPIYLGNDLIDERIVSANDRRTLRSGGRA